jgi:N-acetylneuraminate synthase
MKKNSIYISNKKISTNSKPFIIAEISANHKKSIQVVYQLLKAAADSGVDAVKFQTFLPDEITMNSKKEDFLIKNFFSNKTWNNRSLYSLYQEGSFPFEWHQKAFDRAKKLGLICFSSVFGDESLRLLKNLKNPVYKIASLESLHFPLIDKVIKLNKTIIISTGTLSIKEIDMIVKNFESKKFNKYIIMHCITEYPTESEKVNLKFIKYLNNKYNCPIGFSDHTIGLGSSIGSIHYGACIIEKHFTLNKKIKTLDNQFSLDKDEMKIFVKEIHATWKSIGSEKKIISSNENIYKKFRRSIYTVSEIKKNDVFSEHNIKVVRPGFGLDPIFYKKILGKKAKKDIKKHTALRKLMINT